MANPFYAAPVDLTSAFNNLSRGLDYVDKRMQQDDAQESYNLMNEEILKAVQGGNLDDVSAVMLKYPQMSEAISSTIGFKDDATANNLKEMSFKVLSDPDNAPQYLQERLDYLESVGADPGDTLEMLEAWNSGPEGMRSQLQLLEGMTSVFHPQEYLAWSEVMRKKPDATQYTNVSYDEGGEPWGLNKQTGEFEKVPGGFVKGKSKPQTVVNVGGSQSEFDKTLGKLNAEAFNDINKSTSQANKELAKIDKMLQLNEKAFAGTGAGAKMALSGLASNLGIEIEGLPESEVFRAVSNELVLDKSQQMSGALSEGDMAFLRDTVPNLSSTKEGRREMLRYSKALLERQKEYAKQARAFKKKHGSFDQGAFEDEFAKYAAENPLFKTVEKKIKEADSDTLSDEDLVTKYLN